MRTLPPYANYRRRQGNSMNESCLERAFEKVSLCIPFSSQASLHHLRWCSCRLDSLLLATLTLAIRDYHFTKRGHTGCFQTKTVRLSLRLKFNPVWRTLSVCLVAIKQISCPTQKKERRDKSAETTKFQASVKAIYTTTRSILWDIC